MDNVLTIFREYNENQRWPQLFMKLRLESQRRNKDLSISDAKLSEYRHRNRYSDISPYNHTRVQLKRDDLDYINASMLEWGNIDDEFFRKYILTQGPVAATVSHFWVMIWENNTNAIVMLNKCYERNVKKCEEYFPTVGNKEIVFDDVDLQVIYLSETCYKTFTIRNLLLKDLREVGNERIITHFHYLAWPDFGVPETPQHFLRFLGELRRTKAITQPDKPAVIHCSAGVGRTGTLCLIDICLEILKTKKDNDEPLDVLEILHILRRFRPNLIQAHEQLRFTFAALIEAKNCDALNEMESICEVENESVCDGEKTLPNKEMQRRLQNRQRIKEKLDLMKKNQYMRSIKPRKRYALTLTIGGVVIAVAAVAYAVYIRSFNKYDTSV